MTAQDRREALEQVGELLDEAAELIRGLRDPRLDAYVLAELEGAQGPRGYLGTFARDYVREALEAADDEVEAEAAGAGDDVEPYRGRAMNAPITKTSSRGEAHLFERGAYRAACGISTELMTERRRAIVSQCPRCFPRGEGWDSPAGAGHDVEADRG